MAIGWSGASSSGFLCSKLVLSQGGPEWVGRPLGGPSESSEGQQLLTKWTSEAIRQQDTRRQKPGEERRKSHSDVGESSVTAQGGSGEPSQRTKGSALEREPGPCSTLPRFSCVTLASFFPTRSLLREMGVIRACDSVTV